MYQIVLYMWTYSKVYFFWIGIHYISSNLYPYFCADLSMQGFLTSPFIVITPHCKALGWLQKTSTTVIENMWIVLGTWLCSQMLPNPEIIGQSTATSS